ncbi:MAG: hypothetical protein WC817_02485 [Patescibacteria group bacterium]|jgi:hypothetical protein
MAERFRGENPGAFDADVRAAAAEQARSAMREAREALERAKELGVRVDDHRDAVRAAAAEVLRIWPSEATPQTEDVPQEIKEAA